MSPRVFPTLQIAVAAVGLLAASSHAATLSLLAPFGDFALRGPVQPTTPGPPDFYAESGPNPGWQIAQWDIPDGKLAPFAKTSQGELTLLTATAPEASVTIARNKGAESIGLAQDGAVLPCLTADGKARESDLLFGPKDRSAPGSNALRLPPTSLAGLRYLIVSATVRVSYGMTAHPKGCNINQGVAGVGLVFNNLTRHPPQTLFYQLGFNEYCGLGPAEYVRSCVRASRRPGYFFKHNPFGVDDRLPLAGEPLLRNGERRQIAVNVLPRIEALIAAAPKEMDHEPSHWVLDNLYAGQGLWGDFRLSSQWDSLQVIMQTH